jgi:YggT family protein
LVRDQCDGGQVIFLIGLVVEILTWLVIIHVILSYFMSPYHPLREAIDRLVEPMLMPIRRYIPPLGGLDFSSFFLIIIIQALGALLTGVMVNFA